MESRFDKLIHEYSPEHIFTVTLALRVWVVYGKSKKIGLLLAALYAVALVASLIVPNKQLVVSKATSHTSYTHGDTPLARRWSGTTLYVPGSLPTPFSLMSNSTKRIWILYAITPKQFVVSSSSISQSDIRILVLVYFWLFTIALFVDTITFGLLCMKVYFYWKDGMTIPILNALFTQ